MNNNARTTFFTLFWDDAKHLAKFMMVVCLMTLCAGVVISLGVITKSMNFALFLTAALLCVVAVVGHLSYWIYQCVFYYQRMYSDQAYFYNSVALTIPEIIKEKFCVFVVVQFALQIVLLIEGALLYALLFMEVKDDLALAVTYIQGELPILGFGFVGNMLFFLLFALGSAVCSSFLIIATVTISRAGFLKKFPILGCIIGFIVAYLLAVAMGFLVFLLPINISASIPVVITDDGPQAIGRAFISAEPANIFFALKTSISPGSVMMASAWIDQTGSVPLSKCPITGVFLEPLIYSLGTFVFSQLAQKTYCISQ